MIDRITLASEAHIQTQNAQTNYFHGQTSPIAVQLRGTRRT